MENLAYSLSLNLHDFRDARQITTFEATENAVSDGEILVKVDKLRAGRKVWTDQVLGHLSGNRGTCESTVLGLRRHRRVEAPTN
jgi:hypothetical protein